jgi:hypothetical protein
LAGNYRQEQRASGVMPLPDGASPREFVIALGDLLKHAGAWNVSVSEHRVTFGEAPIAGSLGMAVAVEGTVRLLDGETQVGYEVTAAQGTSFLPMVPLVAAVIGGAFWPPLAFLAVFAFLAVMLLSTTGSTWFVRSWMRELVARAAELATPQHVLDARRANKT